MKSAIATALTTSIGLSVSDPDGPVFDLALRTETEQWCEGCYEYGCAACCCNCTCHVGPRCDGYDR